MKPKDHVTYTILSVFSILTGRSRSRTRYRAAFYIFRFIHDYFPLRKSLALKNIRSAYPDKSPRWHANLLKKAYQFFSRAFLEFFALPYSYDPDRFTVTGQDILDEALSENRGVILVTGHFGPWEMLAAWIGYNGYSFSGIAQRQRNRGANRFFSQKRGESGIRHIFRKSGIDGMYRVLTEGHILGVVMDQDARKKGVMVDFFNLPSSSPRGAALFHKNTSAPIVFVSISETLNYSYFIEFSRVMTDPGDDITEITQKFTSCLEHAIRKNPEQYFWFHNRWKSTWKLINDRQN